MRSLLLIGLLFTQLACAENPESPVAPYNKVQDQDGVELEPFQAQSLHFKGRSPFGLSCDLFITQVQSLGFVLKISYSTPDGSSPADDLAAVKFYNSQSGETSDTPQDGSVFTLSSLRLVSGEAPDFNKMTEYIQNNELLQLLRVNLNEDVDVSQWTEAFYETLITPSQLESNREILNQVSGLEMMVLHGDHYHPSSCQAFTLKDVKVQEFHVGHFDHSH